MLTPQHRFDGSDGSRGSIGDQQILSGHGPYALERLR